MSLAQHTSVEQRRYWQCDVLERAGTGASILFLHGIGGRAASYRKLLETWTGLERLLAWDMPGYGGSRALLPLKPGATDYAAQIAAVLDAAQARRVHLVAQSLGAVIAARYALINPSRVASITLLAPAQGYTVAASDALPSALQQRIDDFETLGAVAYAAQRAGRTAYKPESVVVAQREMATIGSAAHAQAVHMLARADIAADLASISCPVQIIAGINDVVTPLDGIKALCKRLGSKAPQLIEVADAGHAIYLDQPQAVSAAIRKFVETHR
jgi:pimeloyl-ACP methyl ester carboxylesterase